MNWVNMIFLMILLGMNSITFQHLKTRIERNSGLWDQEIATWISLLTIFNAFGLGYILAIAGRSLNS